MRVNIYAEEMPADIDAAVQIISKEIEGQTFTGCRLYLHLPVTVPNAQFPDRPEQVAGPFMHHPGDDDSAAVTFWGKRDLRPVLKLMLERLDEHYTERARQGKLTYLPD